MCIIVYKKENVAFPSKTILKNCFTNNPDGAGFMYPFKGKVHISKGFGNFTKFYRALQKARKMTGSDVPYVMHFRISTQAHGRMDCTHPFPLSDNMADLRSLECDTNIGIAHNGIISLTSSGYSKQITYSDTMEFITDYLSLIIKDNNYYKDPKTLTLIERLCDSKLAIMDSDGYVQLIGDGFVEDNGIVYSNSTYKVYKMKSSFAPKSYSSSLYDKDGYFGYKDYYDNYYDSYEERYNEKTGKYDFDRLDCPWSWGDDNAWDYCEQCSKYEECFKDVKNFSDDD